MQMLNPRAVVERYLDALYGGDADTARQCLADALSFQGPAAKFSGADAYMKASAHAVRAVKRIETHKVFVDDSDVALFYDMHVDHAVGSIAIAEWYHVEGDRIVGSVLSTTLRRQAEGKRGSPHCRSRPFMVPLIRCIRGHYTHGL